ncbi:uncharacterized protein HMPREF1541_04609 [Cyphellophora europaea CBS 101466]|uniref:Pentatricopeptide repeat protein n=1 Tax=Cyphellophora europaea (strain CBS 101466) TaxID=1220924 RepID=W2RX21_CYPE1|nr:uncharacterized protein HMPREF1541_04609 [Cyphellophora europaea CBS 101466]ETN40333.1 hypothetical protein HMPREF1541_04609 [Cyphellophora europaea CBS 101466]
MESFMSFESDGHGPVVTPFKYWNKLSLLLAFAYRSGNTRAHHALDVHRYRAREWPLEERDPDLEYSTLMSIMIGSLASSSHDALQLLAGPHHIFWNQRADCCYHLRRIPARWREIQKSPTLEVMFQQQIIRLKEPGSLWSRTRLKVRHLDLLLEQSTAAEALELVKKFEKTYPFLTDKDALYLVGFYTKLGDVQNALRLLRRVSPELLEAPHSYCIGRCVNLLKLDTVEGTRSSHAFRILPAILELGLPPLDIVHNLVVQNAAKSGLIDVSLDLYRFLETESIPIDPHTHTTLLKHSFLHKDLTAMNKLMNLIQAREDLMHNPHLMSVMMNIVRHICFHERKAEPEECLQHLLAIYDRAYNRGALIRVGILQADQLSSEGSSLPDPHPMVLANFMWAFILTQTHEARVRQVWSALTRLLSRKDPQVSESLHYSGVFRAFMFFFGRSPFTLNGMVEVLEYLLKHMPDQVEQLDWAIIISGFLKHGKEDGANQVRRTMETFDQKFTSGGLQAILDRWPRQRDVRKFIKDLEGGLAPTVVELDGQDDLGMGKEQFSL